MKRFTKCIVALLLIVLVTGSLGTTADAAKAKKKTAAPKAANVLDQTPAQSRLLDAATISYTATLPKVPASDDGVLYLFELQPSEYAIAPTAVPIASAPLSTTPAFTVPFTGARLYTKLALAVKAGGQNVMVAYPQYIVNPEVLATHTKPRRVRPLYSGKGSADFCNLLIQADSNINGVIRDGYTTIQIISDDVFGANEAYKSPYARAAMRSADAHPVTPYRYMLNTNDAAGIDAITQLLTRCAASSAGENYIIGNEVNVRKWNYTIWRDWDSYVREYEQMFRICYNAIKSQDANARIFTCIDQNWDRNRPANHAEYYEYIDGKDFLIKFDTFIKQGGNIDWNIAQHPHPVPLTYAKFWDMSGCKDGAYMKAQVTSGKMMTFQNASILTNFLMQPTMFSPATGAPRRVIFSEVVLTNAQGGDVQAAALYAAYYAAKVNPLVDEIVFVTSYQEPGVDGTPGPQTQAILNSLGTPAEASYDTWAKSMIGISDWSQIIK